MDYIETWKRKMGVNGGSVTKAIRKNSDYFYNKEFKESNAYRNARANNLDLSEIEIDVRIMNNDASPDDKKIYFRPRVNPLVGTYITFKLDEDDEYSEWVTYILLEHEYNSESEYMNAEKCNQTLVLNDFVSFPCVARGKSYGVKLISNIEFENEVDAKVKVTIQRNEITEKYIRPGFRMCFGHSIYGIYKIGDVTTYKDNLFVATCKKDKYMEGYDNIASGVMCQPEFDKIDEGIEYDYMIIGEDKIIPKEYYVYRYSTNSPNSLTWVCKSDTATFIDNGVNVKISCENVGEIITLELYDNGNKVATKNIVVRK